MYPLRSLTNQAGSAKNKAAQELYQPKKSNSALLDDIKLLEASQRSELSFYGDVLQGSNIEESWKKHCKSRLADHKKYINAHPVASYFNLSRLNAYILEQIVK